MIAAILALRASILVVLREGDSCTLSLERFSVELPSAMIEAILALRASILVVPREGDSLTLENPKSLRRIGDVLTLTLTAPPKHSTSFLIGE